MKQVLVFGDSNTWGQNDNDARYEKEVRWVDQLRRLLGDEFSVYDAGLSGRVAGSYETVPEVKHGKAAFEFAVRQSYPLDYLIVALGTNDIKVKYDIKAEQIINNLTWYSEEIRNIKNYDGTDFFGKVIYLLPPNFTAGIFDGDDDKRQEIITTMISRFPRSISLNSLTLSNDGVHYSENDHAVVADAVFKRIKEAENEI